MMGGSAVCDYLGVTTPPKDSPFVDVERIVLELGGYRDVAREGLLWRFPDSTGTVRYRENSRFVFVGASGAVCGLLRSAGGLWLEYLSALGSGPHKVTGMHLAVDLPVAGADYVPPLKAKYPDTVKLTRKAVKTRVMLESGLDGRDTGSFFAGHRKVNKVSAEVYDKQLEAHKKRGEYLPPTTRVEVRMKGDCVAPGQGLTLRDAVECDPCFYHYASPALIEKPPNVSDWVPGVDLNWHSAWEPPEPLERLERLFMAFPDFHRWVELADQAPNGRQFLLGLMRKRLEDYPRQGPKNPENS